MKLFFFFRPRTTNRQVVLGIRFLFFSWGEAFRAFCSHFGLRSLFNFNANNYVYEMVIPFFLRRSVARRSDVVARLKVV